MGSMFSGSSGWAQGWAGPLYPLEHSIGQAIRLSTVLIYGAVWLFYLQPSSACEGIQESRYLESRGTAQVAVHGQNPTPPILLFMFPLTIQLADSPSFEGISPHSEGFTPRSVSAKLQHKQRRTAHDDHPVDASDGRSSE